MHNFREFPGHRSRIIDVRQRVEVEVFSKIVSALCFTKHDVVIRVKNLLMQKFNLIITNHATSSIKCKKNIYLHTYSDHPNEIDLFVNFCFHKEFLTNLSEK